MGIYQEIYQAILTQAGVAASAVALPLWLENTNESPVVGVPYIQCYMNLVDPFQNTLGEAGTNWQSGFVTLLVCYPIGGGYGPALSKADSILPFFKRGKKFVLSTFEITVSKVGVTTPILDENWYKVPVRAFFNAQTPN